MRSHTIKDKHLATEDANSVVPVFLHAVLTQCGLPRSAIASCRTFVRTNGRSSLIIEAGTWWDGHSWINQPLPYGTRPRLVLIHACTEAVRTRSREVELGGSFRAYLRRLGIDVGGKSMEQFKRQMRALVSCRMVLGYAVGDNVVNVKSDPVEQFEA